LRSWRLAEQPHPIPQYNRDDLHDDLVQPTEDQDLPSNVSTEDAHRSTTGEFLGPRQRGLQFRDRLDRCVGRELLWMMRQDENRS
jgi:hypothetical protein